MTQSNKKEKISKNEKFILQLGYKLAKEEILSTERSTELKKLNHFRKELEKALEKIEKKAAKNED